MCFPELVDGREGDGDLGIAEDALASIVSLIVQAARRTRRDPAFLGGRPDENRISLALHQEIQTAQRRRRLRQFEFIPEGIINPPRRPRGRMAGRIDFKVKFRRQIGDYDAYFGVESKRLAPRRPAMARYYVASGIGKFAQGPYSLGHPAALLVGYLVAPGAQVVLDDLGRRLRAAHPGCTPLAAWDGPVYRDATIVEGIVPRGTGMPIRLLHAVVRMHA